MGTMRSNSNNSWFCPKGQIETELINKSEDLLLFAEKQGIILCPLDVKTIAEKLNIEVCFEELPEDISGILKKDENNKWKIKVNANHHPNRQRYTIAHELGHYCLHRYQESFFEDQIFFRGLERTRTEMEANSFASEILIPEKQFQKFLQDNINDVDKLATKFGVATLTLRIRAKELGFIGHGLR
jgi:Zn-dependent peptidase ImmA (M78 family)